MSDFPPREFGKRRPAPLPDAAPTAPTKRSSHVALLMFGTVAVGSTAYFVMSRQSCPPPPSPSMAAPALPQTRAGATSCTSGVYSGHGGGGGGYSRSRYSFFGGGSSSSSSSASDSASGGVTRGGFGSFAHAFGFGGG